MTTRRDIFGSFRAETRPAKPVTKRRGRGRPPVEPTKLVGTRLPLDIIEELERIAGENGSTVSGEARRIITDFFDDA